MIYQEKNNIEKRLNGIIKSSYADDDKNNEVDIKLWKNKYSSSWHGKYERDLLEKFKARFYYFNYEKGNFFHVTLKFTYDPSLTPEEANDKISNSFQKYISSLKRTKKKVGISRYQAIKEFDTELVPMQSYRCPHFHLFIELSSRSQKNAVEILRSRWKLGNCVAYPVNTEEYFFNLSDYCTNINSKKRPQMMLPKEYFNCKTVTRVYTSKNFKSGHIRCFKKTRMFQDILIKQSLKDLITSSLSDKTTIAEMKRKKNYPTTYKCTKTYEERLKEENVSILVKNPDRYKSKRGGMPHGSINKLNKKYDHRDKSYNLTLSTEHANEFLDIVEELNTK